MRVLFIGTGDIALPTLEWLASTSGHQLLGVVTQPDKPAGRHQELRPPPVKEFALGHGVPVVQPAKIRAPEAVATIAAWEPDVIVVMAYGQLLPRPVLEAPRLACLNLHASLLPRHRGAAPVQAAILAGDRETGITVIYVDEHLDAGDVLLARRIPIRRRETGGSLHQRLATLAPAALRDALDLLASGNAPRTPQPHALATYTKKLCRADGELDWTAPAREIERRVRAMHPWPAAWTTLPHAGGRPATLKIFAAILCRRASGAPGQVLRADARGILVGTGDGSLLLREVQIEGGRRMSAADFLRGHPLPAGVVLGAAG